MEEPEIIKMLRYILLLGSFFVSVQCHPLVTEQTPIATVPIHHSGEDPVVPSLLSDNSHKISLSGRLSTEVVKEDGENSVPRAVRMSPVENIKDILQDDISPNNTGGQKRTRQVQEESQSSNSAGGSPPPTEELCSIFQFFLESRRYSRCRVSNTYNENERSNGALSGQPPPSRGPPELGHRFDFNSNFHRPVSNEVAPSPDPSNGDNFQSESENREVENVPQRPVLHELSPQMGLSDSSARMDVREQTASKRFDHLDDIMIHGGPPGLPEDHIGLPPPGPPPTFPKSSLDRTTIIVPDRPCPRGERRDHKGFCRRIVRVRPNYQYGPPPPPPYGPSRPVRYYYSRFVSVPTLQFFIPAVP